MNEPKQFHDKNGTPLKVGDEVLMRMTIEHLVDGEGDPDFFAADIGLSFCTKDCEKVEPVEVRQSGESVIEKALRDIYTIAAGGTVEPAQKKGMSWGPTDEDKFAADWEVV